jgi:hypothetical protein
VSSEGREQGGLVAWSTRPYDLPAERAVRTAVRLPPEIRRPADDGDDTMEVVIRGVDARSRVELVRASLTALLPQIPELTADALANAPPEWRSYFIDGDGAAEYTPLWLMGVDYDADGSVRLEYDYGALGTIVLTIYADGRREVTHED